MKKILMFFLFVFCVFFVEAMEVGMEKEKAQNKLLLLDNAQAPNRFGSLISRGLTKKEREAAVPYNEAMFKKMRQKDYQLALEEVRKQGKDGDLLSRQVFSWHCKPKNITFVRFCFDDNSEGRIDHLSCYGCIIDLSMKYATSGEREKLESLKVFMKNSKKKSSNVKKRGISKANVKSVELESLVKSMDRSSIEKMIGELKNRVADDRLFNAVLHTNYSYFKREHTKLNFMQLLRGDYAHIIERVGKFFGNSIWSQCQLFGLRSLLSISTVSKLLTKNSARYFADADKITIEKPCFVYRNYPVNWAIYHAITLELFVKYLIFGNDNDIKKLEQIVRIDGTLSFSINKLREIVNDDILFRNIMRSSIRFFYNNPKRQNNMMNCLRRPYPTYDLIKMGLNFF